jgi:hypothetical protein
MLVPKYRKEIPVAQIPFTILKGNKSIPLIILKINPIVRPTILNGKSTSQISGNRKSMMSANGQHIAKSKNHNTTARKNLMI